MFPKLEETSIFELGPHAIGRRYEFDINLIHIEFYYPSTLPFSVRGSASLHRPSERTPYV